MCVCVYVYIDAYLYIYTHMYVCIQCWHTYTTMYYMYGRKFTWPIFP